MTEQPLLEVEGLCKAFGGVRAVAGIGFALTRGDIRAVIGPNGAGKTTLFNLLGGQLPCDGGSIRFEGERIDGLSPPRIWRRGISRTFQVPATFASLTLRENLQTVLLSRLGRSREMFPAAAGLLVEPAMALLNCVGLSTQAQAVCGTLSLSDLKRLELALALAGEPRLLLLDEPTAGMSSGERAALIDLVGRIVRERNLTVLFTEHDMDVVFSIASGILVMHQGRILIDAAPESVRRDPEVRRVYLGGGA